MKSFHLKFTTILFILASIMLVSCKTKSDQTEVDITKSSNDSTQVQGKSITIKVKQEEPQGSYLTDGQGMSLYMFLKDTALHQDNPESTCYDECAEAWPPVLVKNKEVKAGARVDTTILGTVKRKDGTMQVTYNDYPLYYYVDDKEEGDIMGQDKKEYSYKWFLVKPNGDMIEDVDVDEQ